MRMGLPKLAMAGPIGAQAVIHGGLPLLLKTNNQRNNIHSHCANIVELQIISPSYNLYVLILL